MSRRGPTLPSFRLSLSPSAEVPSNILPPQISNSNSRARSESRKLLSHVLTQLSNRRKPSPISHVISNAGRSGSDSGLDLLVESLKDAVRIKSLGQNSGIDRESALQDGLEHDADNIFSTDATFELMVQLKDVLIMSVSQGWRIFDESSVLQEVTNAAGERSSSPFRRSRASFHGGKRTRSPEAMQVPELLSLCLSVLTSVVAEDCRYKIISPRPSRPPNALQALTINVAQLLIHANRHDPRVISQIGFAVIPTFSTFHPELHPRLLSFFEENLIRPALQHLRQMQGVEEIDATPLDQEDVGASVVAIHVDGVEDDDGREASRFKPTLKVRSTSAPHQGLHMYHLASLVSPLLAAILECVDIEHPSESHSDLPYRFYRLLDLILTLKVDAYNDLFQVVAYHDSKSRKLAVTYLAMHWPKATGHATISGPLFLEHNGVLGQPAWTRKQADDHRFLPWKFIHRDDWVSFDGSSQHDCRSCTKAIYGFGLLCPFCMCAVHFDCYDYPEGNHLIQYEMETDSNVQRVAMYRFSTNFEGGANNAGIIHENHHAFRQVNLFNICLCYVCRDPLWGCAAQGMKCDTCSLCVHATCLSSTIAECGTAKITSRHMVIEWQTLRRTCLEYFADIFLTQEGSELLGYEEVSISCGVLETQLQILTNGIALGSIVVLQNGKNVAHTKNYKVDEFELHRALKVYMDRLASNNLPCSAATKEYIEENSLLSSKHSIMFDLSNLVYISTSLKAPLLATPDPPSSDLLNVAQLDQLPDSTHIDAHPYELLPLSHLREVLDTEFNVRSIGAAKLILRHLDHLAFFDRVDQSPYPFDNFRTDQNVGCIFPLPLGLDLSTDVETLVSAVESCLADLDLSVNEFALLLVVRKLWPNGLMSEYGLKRVGRSVIYWVLAEDDNLATVLRDFVAKKDAFPRLRSITSWPFSKSLRPGTTSTSSNSGDYIAVRRLLTTQYVLPWLLALHNQDADLYKDLLYDTCYEFAGGEGFDPYILSPNLADQEQLFRQSDNTFRSILRLFHASVIFSVFDGVILRWLEFITTSNLYSKPMSSLSRLLSHEAGTAQRLSSLMDLTSPTVNQPGSSSVDPLRVIVNFAHQTPRGLSISLRWLLLFSRSGIDIPTAIFMQFCSLVTAQEQLINVQVLVQAVLSSVWLRSLGRQDIQQILAALHAQFSRNILESLKSAKDMLPALSIIRQSLASCLLLYGCDRNHIVTLGMILVEEIKEFPSRRKLTVRGSDVVDPINVEPSLLIALGVYAESAVEEVLCLTAKFLNTFLMDSPFLEPYEVDNFILRNGKFLASCAWKFYNIQRHDVASIRTNFLLRTLVVDAELFQDILSGVLSHSNHWEQRLLATNCLFRFVSDVTSPVFCVEGRQWRSTVTDTFYCYFTSLWADPKEEIRLSVRTCSATLLPAHLLAISQCWNESMSKAPISERLRLASFLLRLHPHFPGWRVLSWDVIIETLTEYDSDVGNVIHLVSDRQFDPEMAHLRVAIIVLGLQMIADGVEIDTFSLLKLKVELVRVIGFTDISVLPLEDAHSIRLQFGDVSEIPELAFPCIEGLVSVLDATHLLTLPSSTFGTIGEQSRFLVGSIFLDVSLSIVATAKDLTVFPVLTLKSLLESVYIIIHKHDFESKHLGPQQAILRRAVLRTVEMLSKDISYDVRHVALSVCQAFIKQCQNFMGSVVYTIFEHVTQLVDSQSIQNQDALAAQGKLLIGTTLQSFCNDGLFINLLKRPLPHKFFAVLKQIFESWRTDQAYVNESLGEDLLRDTLNRTVDADPAGFQILLNNLFSYLDIVYRPPSNIDVTFIGQHIIQLVRRMCDGSLEEADPSPLVSILALLIQSEPRHYKQLLPSINIVLRTALNRLYVDTACLALLSHASACHHHPGLVQGSTSSVVPVVNVLFEILLDGLRLKARILPVTLKSIIGSLTKLEHPVFPPSPAEQPKLFANLIDGACHFLEHHLWLDEYTENDCMVSVDVARLLLQAASEDHSIMQRFSGHGSEKYSRQIFGVRSWSMLILAVLLNPRDDWPAMLFSQFSSFTQVYVLTLRVYLQSGFGSPESATTDINHAYVAIKLWLMLAQRVSSFSEDSEVSIFRVWNELWPPFEDVFSALEIEAQANLSTTLTMLTSTSIAELVIYACSLKASLTLETTAHLTILNRLRGLNRGEGSYGKAIRALRGTSEGHLEVSPDVLLQQCIKDIVATEKLRVVDVKREPGKPGVERRKDLRFQ